MLSKTARKNTRIERKSDTAYENKNMWIDR